MHSATCEKKNNSNKNFPEKIKFISETEWEQHLNYFIFCCFSADAEYELIFILNSSRFEGTGSLVA